MLSRKKLHGDDAETSRRNVSADTPPYSNVPDGELDDEHAPGGVVAGGAQVAAGEPFHFHRARVIMRQCGAALPHSCLRRASRPQPVR